MLRPFQNIQLKLGLYEIMIMIAVIELIMVLFILLMFFATIPSLKRLLIFKSFRQVYILLTIE